MNHLLSMETWVITMVLWGGVALGVDTTKQAESLNDDVLVPPVPFDAAIYIGLLEGEKAPSSVVSTKKIDKVMSQPNLKKGQGERVVKWFQEVFGKVANEYYEILSPLQEKQWREGKDYYAEDLTKLDLNNIKDYQKIEQLGIILENPRLRKALSKAAYQLTLRAIMVGDLELALKLTSRKITNDLEVRHKMLLLRASILMKRSKKNAKLVAKLLRQVNFTPLIPYKEYLMAWLAIGSLIKEEGSDKDKISSRNVKQLVTPLGRFLKYPKKAKAHKFLKELARKDAVKLLVKTGKIDLVPNVFARRDVANVESMLDKKIASKVDGLPTGDLRKIYRSDKEMLAALKNLVGPLEKRLRFGESLKLHLQFGKAVRSKRVRAKIMQRSATLATFQNRSRGLRYLLSAVKMSPAPQDSSPIVRQIVILCGQMKSSTGCLLKSMKSLRSFANKKKIRGLEFQAIVYLPKLSSKDDPQKLFKEFRSYLGQNSGAIRHYSKEYAQLAIMAMDRSSSTIAQLEDDMKATVNRLTKGFDRMESFLGEIRKRGTPDQQFLAYGIIMDKLKESRVGVKEFSLPKGKDRFQKDRFISWSGARIVSHKAAIKRLRNEGRLTMSYLTTEEAEAKESLLKSAPLPMYVEFLENGELPKKANPLLISSDFLVANQDRRSRMNLFADSTLKKNFKTILTNVNRKPQVADEFILISKLQYLVGVGDKAIKTARQGFGKWPALDEFTMILAIAHMQKGQLELAENILMAITDQRFGVQKTNLLGIIKFMLGDREEALKAWNAARKLDKRNYAAGMNLALFHFQMGNFSRARSDLQNLRKLYPKNKEIHAILAILKKA